LEDSMLSVSSTALARLAARSRRPAAAVAARGMAMQAREELEELPANFRMDAVRPPPHGFGEPYEEELDPMAYVRKPVTSAHAVDPAGAGAASALDSAAFGPDGSVVHGRYGALGAAARTVPLEYLALLRPAAEGAAALREIAESSADTVLGTVLVYGATRPAGTAAAQLAAAAGHAVVAVVDGGHSGHDEMVDTVKGLTAEPGTAVPEEYALCKANFRDLVERTVAGDDGIDAAADLHRFLADFKENVLDYVEAYPSDLPAAVDAEQLRFVGKEKDRANFRINMDAYLSQYAPGADPIDPAQLEANFTVEQYALFKSKFGVQTTAVISGGDGKTDTDRFAPAELVRDMCAPPGPGRGPGAGRCGRADGPGGHGDQGRRHGGAELLPPGVQGGGLAALRGLRDPQSEGALVGSSADGGDEVRDQ